MKNISRILKAATESFTLGAGVATIIVSVVTAFVAPPLFVTFVVASGVGVVCGVIGGYHEAEAIKKEEQNNRKSAARQEWIYHELKDELDEIKVELESHQQFVRDQFGEFRAIHLDQAQSRIDLVRIRAAQLREEESSASPASNSPRFFSSEESLRLQLLQEEKPSSPSSENENPDVIDVPLTRRHC